MSRFLITILVLLFSSLAQATALVYDVSGGKLAGIQNINVNGTLYDVSFIDGSYTSIFGDASNLAFTSSGDATAASNALISALADGVVANDGNTYNFDTNDVKLIEGCGYTMYCYILTPYGDYTNTSGLNYVSDSAAYVWNDTTSDFSTSYPMAVDTDTGTGVTDYWLVYARWSPSTSVPEPATIALMGLGLAGVGFTRRRTR